MRECTCKYMQYADANICNMQMQMKCKCAVYSTATALLRLYVCVPCHATPYHAIPKHSIGHEWPCWGSTEQDGTA